MRKDWQAPWKVLPNFQSWIDYFKSNEANFKNEDYYDIDHEDLGELGEKNRYFFPSDNSTIIHQSLFSCNRTQQLSKVLKGALEFGISSEHFWCSCPDNVKLSSARAGEV